MVTHRSGVHLLIPLILLLLAVSITGSAVEDLDTLIRNSERLSQLPATPNNAKNNVLRILGGTAMNRPCCASTGNGIVHCFVRNPASYVDYMAISRDGGKEWVTLEGQVIFDDIECVISGKDELTLMALDINGALSTNERKDKWKGWSWRSGVLAEVPSCVVRNGEINCVHRRDTNSGYRTDKVEGEWEWNYHIGGVFLSPLKCISIDKMRIDCFGAAAPKRFIRHRQYDGDDKKWLAPWKNRGGYAIGRPSATSWGPDRIDVFYIGIGSTVKHLVYDGDWQEEASLSNDMQFEKSPECVATKVDRIHCFAIGEASSLYRSSFNGSVWSNWTMEGGTFLDTPTCVTPLSGKDVVACYVRDFKLRLVEKYFDFEVV